MRDPFPYSMPPSWVRPVNWLAGKLNLDTLPMHFHEILVAFAFYHFICDYVSPALSARIFPRTYSKFDARTKLNWNVHVVSFVQSTFISALAIYVLWNDEELKKMDYRERVWGYTGAAGLVQALGCGYFLWDLWVSAMNFDVFGPGLVAHAISAFWVYMMGFRPFTAPYSAVFILYELSSPFLNIHWALDKLDMTGSDTQLVNGIFLMSSFFGSRLVWGVYQSYCVFSDVFRAMAYQNTAAGKTWLRAQKLSQPEDIGGTMRFANNKEIPYWYAITYLTANAVLTLLNIYWFGKMIETIRKRFDPPFGTRKVSKGVEPIMGRGIDSDGVKSVEVSSQQTRRRVKKEKDGNEDPLNYPAS